MTGLSPIGPMIRGGFAAISRRRALVATLYAVQAAFALVTLFAVKSTLATLYGPHPLFDRGVHGDLAALVSALQPHGDVVLALVWAGAAVALTYGALSWYLTAGLLGAFRNPNPPRTRREGAAEFGAAGALHVAAFARLWLWSIIPYVVAAIALGIGVAMGARHFEDALTMGEAIGRPLLGALPGLALVAIVACSVDYARVLLVAGNTPKAGRALLRGLRITFTRPAAILHYFVYLLAWGGITALYVEATIGRPFAGAGGALAIFVIRQLVSAARFCARVATCAGQQALVDRSIAPAASLGSSATGLVDPLPPTNQL